MLLIVALTCSIFASAALGDRAVKSLEGGGREALRALVDNGTHAIVGGVSWCLTLVLLRRGTATLGETLWQTVACALLASLIDLDHFMAAKSLRLQDALQLSSRPILHNTSLMTIIFLAILSISYLIPNDRLYMLPWIFLVAFFSHHTRDATRRGYWITPFGSTAPINYWLYLTICAITPFVVCYVITMIGYEKYHVKNSINLRSVNYIV